MTREPASLRFNERPQAVCDEQSHQPSQEEVLRVRSPFELERRYALQSPRAGEAPALEASCEEALLACLETETVKARSLWQWEDGARLELSVGGRSKIGAVYHKRW